MAVVKSGIHTRTGHFVLRSKDAVSKDIFGNRKTPAEILNSIEVSELLPMDDPLNMNINYFHMFGATENHIIIPLLSVTINPETMLQLMASGKPIIDSFKYTPVNAEYRIFNKQKFKFYENQKFVTEPSFFAHAINAYDDENGDIQLDTVLTTNCSVFSLFTFNNINATGADLHAFYETISPVGVPLSYKFPLSKKGGKVHVEPTRMFEKGDEAWQCFEKGGVEFPITERYGSVYSDFWACGFGSVMPDRLYHVDVTAKRRWVYRVENYSPSEPQYIRQPNSDITKSDGVVVSLMSPINDLKLRPFMAILNATTMEEIGRAYTPPGVTVPVGFHGAWVGHVVPEDVITVSSYHDGTVRDDSTLITMSPFLLCLLLLFSFQ